MKSQDQITHEELNKYRLNVLFKVFRDLMVLFSILGVVISVLAFDVLENAATRAVFGFGIVIVSIGAIYFVRYKKGSEYLQFILFMLASILGVIVVNMITMEWFMTLSIPITISYILVAFFTFERKYAYIMIGVQICFLIGHMVVNPDPTVYLGKVYYATVFGSMILLLLVVHRGIGLFKWYEELLFDRIRKVTEQNSELEAYNEEYIATQAALYEQVDEVNRLGEERELLLEKMNMTVNQLSDGVAEYIIADDRFDLSVRAQQILYASGVEEGADINEAVHKILERNPEAKVLWEQLVAREKDSGYVTLSYTSDDEIHYLEISMTSFVEDGSCGSLLFAVKDVTTEKKFEESMYQAAYYDRVTGFYNQNGFERALTKKIEKGNDTVTVFLLELNDFRYFTNIYGQVTADHLLASVTNNLKSVLPETALFGTMHREQIILACERVMDPASAMALIEKSNMNYVNDNMFFDVTFSVGVAKYEEGITAMRLMGNAQAALYHAIEHKIKTPVFYEVSQRLSVERRVLLTNAMNLAMQNDEIFLQYQPKYDVKHEKVIGFEGLARWISKVHGFVSPADFVEIAEQTGIIINLGDYLARKACKFCSLINAVEHRYTVSINVSGKQLLDESFAERFINLVETEHAPFECIAIEITETYVIDNVVLAEKQLSKIRAAGIRIYLDDFGTGFSSFSYLNRLPIDVLKIDKSLVDPIEEDSKSVKTIDTIVKMAKNFGMEVVAEGVETEGQYKILEACHVDMIQGYYIAKPMDPESCEQFLQPDTGMWI